MHVRALILCWLMLKEATLDTKRVQNVDTSTPLASAGAVSPLQNSHESNKHRQPSNFAECMTCLLVTCPAQSGDVTVSGVGLQDRKNLLRAPVIFKDFLLLSLVTKGVMTEAVSQRDL